MSEFDLEDVKSDDPRKQYEALRDYLVQELKGKRCVQCEMSRLKEGATAALVLQLRQVLQSLQELPVPDAEKNPLEKIRQRRDNVLELRPGSAS